MENSIMEVYNKQDGNSGLLSAVIQCNINRDMEMSC